MKMVKSLKIYFSVCFYSIDSCIFEKMSFNRLTFVAVAKKKKNKKLND